jgi:centrosomal protein CEP164
MYTANNQVIFEEIYDENIQPTEDEIIEYANFLGIDLKEEFELMWIARQGVMAPLPRGNYMFYSNLI